MNQELPEIVIYPDRKKTLYYFVNFLLFSLLGLWLVFEGGVAIVPGLILSILLVPGTIFHGYRLFSTSPALIINSHGLYDNTSLIGISQITWQEIQNITGGDYISLYPLHRAQILSRQPLWKRAIFVLFRMGTPKSPFLMPTQCLSGESSEIFHIICHYMSANINTLD